METDRLELSRMSLLGSTQGRSGHDRQNDDTNRRYYRKVLVVLFNLISLGFRTSQPSYDPTSLLPFLKELVDLCEVGLLDPAVHE